MIDSENNNSPKKRFFSEIFSNLGEIKKPKKENTSYELNIMNEDNEIPKKKKSADSNQSKTLSKISKKDTSEIEPIENSFIISKKKVSAKTLKTLDISAKEYEIMTETEFNYWKKLSKEERHELKKLEQELNEYEFSDIPERFRILKFNIPLATKRNIMQRFTQFEMMETSDPEYFKLNRWMEGILKIPFGNYVNLPVSIKDPSDKINHFISDVRSKMDSSIFGHVEAKDKIMQVVCQWISNPQSSGNIIALQGPPGIGKTSLIKNGISKALGRPFHMIALGGATDATFLEGHNYTYEGANWGRIVSIIMDSKIMNPIIFFDELDKVSGTKHGEEIIGVLTHLTDQTQNSSFQDKYFSGIDLDLSRCLFIFSYNDENLLNPILKDRLVKINLSGFSTTEKINISKNYILKELNNNIGFDDNAVIFSDEAIKEIIETYTDEQGVRELRRCIETILLKLNMRRFTEEVRFPLTINSDIIKEYLKKQNTDDFLSKMLYL